MTENLQTSRLLLRRWQDSDLEEFVQLNADPDVMEFFLAPLNREETLNMVRAIETRFDTEELGLWAVELRSTGEFIGFVGLSRPKFQAKFTPCVEVGWRLARRFWGHGYAPEAAAETLRDGFERLQLEEILSWTSTLNEKSIRVMQKIGMTRDPDDDFMHPMLPDTHRLRPHVLYRAARNDWLSKNSKS